MALSEQAKSRLTTLIQFMRRLPEKAAEHFDMNASWAEHVGPHAMSGVVSKETLLDCGTKACAMGWAGAIPEFQNAGLCIHWYPDGNRSFRGAFDSDAAMQFFDLEYEQFWDLFNNDEEQTRLKTPKQWATHAARLMRKWDRV